MSAPPPPPPPLRSGGLSLYDHLQDPNDKSSSTTISSAPVLYSQGQSQTTEAAPKKPLDPSLRFQPIRRPPAKSSKPAKPKPSFPPATAATTASSAASPSNVATAAAPQQKTSLADWAATQEDEWRYSVEEKRQRGGRKKKKKRHQVQVETDWDDIYDPARPTNVDEYLKSDERIDEVREWKALLYRHRRRKDDSDMSEDDDSRPAPSSKSLIAQRVQPLTEALFRSIRSSILLQLCAAAAAVAAPGAYTTSKHPAASAASAARRHARHDNNLRRSYPLYEGRIRFRWLLAPSPRAYGR